jgi:hypothetical protein
MSMSKIDFEGPEPAVEARRLAALGATPDAVVAELARQSPWLDADERAALWLVAWCVRDRGRAFTVGHRRPRQRPPVRLPIAARRRTLG